VRLSILHVYPKADYFTGAAIQLRELARGLAARGHEVVVATRPSPLWVDKTREAGLTHYELPMRSEVDLPSALGLARIVRRHRVQVVHAHKGRARTLALLAGLVDPFNRLGYATPRVHAIVAVCESIKQGLVARGIRADKIEVMYPSVDTDLFHPGIDGGGVRKELGLGPEHFVVTQIGQRSWKGNDDVVDAMARVLPGAPHARLLVVGARVPSLIVDRARALGIAEHVRTLGYREDVPQILAASDCCIDASWQGLGLTGTLPEALAVGRPVLASNLEGHPEVAIPGRTGYLFEPRDVAGIAAAILRLAADPEHARAMGRAGRELVLREFATGVRVERTEALYRRLLAGKALA
jgi:glycosyltransferase involved in cell wall biosynthesis